MKQWQIVFFIAAGVYIFCATFYNIFASGERQPWDNPLKDDDVATTTPMHVNGNGTQNGNGLIHETRQ